MLYADRWILCADVAGRGVTSRERPGGRREGRGGGMRRGERRRDEGESGGMTASKENKTIMTPVIHTTVSIHHKGCCGYLHSMPQ